MRGYSLIKVAIFGGSFDPPHRGHQEIVRRAVEKLDIDKLIILPAFLNPFKRSTLASPEQRLAWCRTLFGKMKETFTDDQIVEITSVIGLFNFINRFNDSLGVLPDA